MTTERGELVVRDEPAQIAPVPVPRELQELGVKIGVSEDSGTRVVYLPPGLRQAVNLVNPTTSYVQADPNWTPGISVVHLDVARDTYPLPGGKKGLSKQALETLAKAAGVLYTRTARVPRDELQDVELWAYRATVGFRRSDGTIDEVTRERGFNGEVERAEIEEQVTTGNRHGARGSDTWEAEVKKRWLQMLRFGPAMTESKAINRALRAGLSIPTSLPAEAISKPFLVVGYNFTPDYNDPEVKRALVAVGLNAHAAIYGGRDVSDKVPELEAADIPAEALETGTPATLPAEDGSPPLGDDVREQAAGDGDGAGRTAPEPDAGGSSSEEPPLDDEPEPPASTPGGLPVPEAAIEAAGAVVARGDNTVRQVAARIVAGDAKARTWAAWALSSLAEDDERRAALTLYLQRREPAVFEALLAEGS